MNHDKKVLLALSIGVFALILQFGFHQPLYTQILITIFAIFITLSMLSEMVKTLKSGKYGIDILAVTAIVATLAVGEYWASLMILIMLTGGDALEDYASQKARKELTSLLAQSPQNAHIVKGTTTIETPVELVQVDDMIVVKPGEIVPVDGQITAGSSTVNESSLTGESQPLTKTVGDLVMSGSINGDNAITIQATKLAKDSQYQQIISLVKQSEAQPARFVRLADQYAVPFTLIAYAIAIAAWVISKDPKRFAEVLVVASPCPLILAAPISIVSGMSRLSKHHIVVKTGTTLEKLSKAKTVAFDKTGTITKGIVEIDQIVAQKPFTQEDIIQLAASIEQDSNHILARSLIQYTTTHNYALQPVQQLEEVPAFGVKGLVNQQEIRVGKSSFIANFPENTVIPSQTTIYVSINDTYAGYITFTDTIRTEAPTTIKALKNLGIHDIMMLTGDHEQIAKKIATQVGISTVHAECLPKDKIDYLKQIPIEKRPAIMVGDGVNDAPALIVADVGIAMGASGSTSASESADAVILIEDISKVADAVQISKETMVIAKQAVLIGIIICIILMLIASTGIIPALIGAILQELVDTVSILYSLRARNDKTKMLRV